MRAGRSQRISLSWVVEVEGVIRPGEWYESLEEEEGDHLDEEARVDRLTSSSLDTFCE